MLNTVDAVTKTLRARTSLAPQGFEFGSASADAEASDRPELLLRGYFDYSGLIDTALNGSKFLFLGHKGSGKSALGEHLALATQDDPQTFIRMVDIADLSYAGQLR